MLYRSLAVVIGVGLLFLAYEASAIGARGGASIRGGGNTDPEDEILPDFMIRPFGNVYFSWRLYYNQIRDREMVATWNYTSDVWVGVGLKSSKRMFGPMVICYLSTVKDNSTGKSTGGEAQCKDYTWDRSRTGEEGYGVQLAEQQLSSATAAGLSEDADGESVVTVSFRRIIKSWNVTDAEADIEMDAAHRVIFAKGEWDSENNIPRQHHVDNTDTALINFQTGKVENLSSGYWKIALGINCGLALLLVIIVKVVRVIGVRISHTVRNVFAIFFALMFLGMVFGFILARYADYKVQVEAKAFPRSFGDGAAFCFAALLIPVSKRIVFSDLLGVGYERAIKYHMYVAFLFLACASFHGAGMFYFYDWAFIQRWRDKDKVSRLPGLLTYLCILLMVPLALLRFKVSYRAFRWSHYTYVLASFFAVCHYPRLAIFAVPGLSLLVLSFLHKRLATPVDEEETMLDLKYDAAANVVIVDFVKDDAVDPGCYYFMGIKEISRIEQHPFAVAKLDTKKYRTVRFVIRPTKNPNGWTQALKKMAENKLMPTSYKLDGPHGVLQVRATSYSHLLLMAGGMGITGMNHFLLECVDDADEVNMGNKKSITLIWVCKEADLFKVFSEDLMFVKKEMANTEYEKIHCHIKVFITNSSGASMPTPEATEAINKAQKSFTVSFGQGRPNLAAELSDISQKIGDTKSDPVATYISGPEDFQKGCGDALGKSSMSHHIHYEAFSI